MSEPDKVIRTTIPSRYSQIHGRDLICPVCGTGAKDVGPDFRLDPDHDAFMPVFEITSFWHCHTGHQNATTCKREPAE